MTPDVSRCGVARTRVAAAATVLFLAASSATAQAPLARPDATTDLNALNARINDQVRRLSELRVALEREEAALQELRRSVGEQILAGRRGGASAAAPATSTVVASTRDGSLDATGSAAPGDAASGEVRAGASVRTAPIFEEPSVLTARGGLTVEPSLQYGHSTNNRVTLLGYTIVPALLVGLIDVREVKRDTVTAAMTLRYGLTNRWELEARLPYLYRSDTTQSREIATGTAVDSVIGARGNGIGDVEVAARYQINTRANGSALPFMIGSLRYKSRTGTDPFEVVTDCQTRCIGNTTGSGQPLTLPTGSGFHSLQAGLTWLLPSDPAVLFGTFSYLHNFARSDVMRTVRNGERESIGKIAPGGVFGFNVGIGLAINDVSSFSVGYDHSSVARTKQNGITVAGATRAQLGTMLLGFSQRLNPKQTVNVSLGAGLTADTPDVTLTVRMPWTL